MKHTKKLASLLLALVMLFTMSTAAMAASGTNDNSGKITIDNAVVGQTYTIYQILKLESYNEEAGAYAYKAADAWTAFISGADVKDTYVKVDDQGYVTWVNGASVAEFAAKAQAYAKANSFANQGSTKAESATVEFSGLNLGYYLLDSSLGTLCSLDTAHTVVTIKEKNAAPTNEKKIEEDSTNTLGSVNDADIGQMVKFVSKITIPVGSATVVYHDKMSASLTLVEGEEGKAGVTVYRDEALTDILPDGNWHQTAPGKDEGCTFEVDFADCLDLVTKDTTLYIAYYAVVNENAVVGGEGNPNESWLSYSEDGKTTTVPSKTTTYTWKLDVLKYTLAGEGGQTETPLAGAQFVLYKMANGVKNYAVVNADNKMTDWTANAHDSAESVKASVITTPAEGNFTITGLDSDTYYLEEIAAPAGYNKLSSAITVVINDKGEVTYNGISTGTVKVLNQTGAELPSTGGMGTTIFYVIGSLLVVVAGVLLVTRKRMSGRA